MSNRGPAMRDRDKTTTIEDERLRDSNSNTSTVLSHRLSYRLKSECRQTEDTSSSLSEDTTHRADSTEDVGGESSHQISSEPDSVSRDSSSEYEESGSDSGDESSQPEKGKGKRKAAYSSVPLDAGQTTVNPAPRGRGRHPSSPRSTEEARPRSFINPFIPTPDDIQRWINQGAPEPVRPRRPVQRLGFAMPGPQAVTSSTQPACVVQDYYDPNGKFQEDYSVFKTLTDAQKASIIAREAEEYGIEKPQGYNVSFHYNPHVEYHHFGSSHPMKPWRLTLTKQLVLAYGLEYAMDLYEPRPASKDELAIFHDRDYLQFLQKITPQNMKHHDDEMRLYGFGGESNDCPVFEGLWNYVSLYGGASMHAAQNLLNGQSDIAINWSGGLHHAKKKEASGFCYINDIVLAIQHLLTQHQRVLYIDIDVHHGDGVEQAFESSDRVFTLSYHKHGIDRNYGYQFFPGTGDIDEMGPKDPTNPGKGHALNIPIDDGIDDDQYKWLFKTITGAVVEKYQPTAIVLQSGADSLGGDRLGRFNLNIKAHGFCVETVKTYGRPMLVIGGGGYTPRNVARTWCHETSVCVGASLHNDLPTHIPYIQAFQGDENGGGTLYPELHNRSRHDNMNTSKTLQTLVTKAMENLRYLEGAPSVVVNTQGIDEEQLMRIREEIDREIEEERQDKMHASVEKMRRTKERNVGGRGERGLR